MRPNLTCGLLALLKRQCGLGNYQASIFDLGTAFEAEEVSHIEAYVPGSHQLPLETLKTGVREWPHAAFAYLGRRGDEHWSSDKKSTERKATADFFDAKGAAENLIESLAVQEGRWNAVQYRLLGDCDVQDLQLQAPWIPLEWLHPGRSAVIVWPGKPKELVMGFVGEVKKNLRSELLNLPTGLQVGLALGELRVGANIFDDLKDQSLERARAFRPKYKINILPPFPVVERDFACAFKPETRSGDVEAGLRAVAPEILVDLKCVDEFVLPTGARSLSYRFWLQARDRTLEEKELQEFSAKVVELLRSKFGGELRG